MMQIDAERVLQGEVRVAQRASDLFEEQRRAVYQRGDRLFAGLMVGQWLFAIGMAVVFSPYAWSGKVPSVHVHVYAAILLGGAISSLPIALALLWPGRLATRLVIAVAQVLWSALLIHLSGGRIETHFHVFGSLAFLAFYRDWRVLAIATVVVAGDHLLRGIMWSESVYGIINPEWWRFLEHAGWVIFEDSILVLGIADSIKEMRAVARRQAEVEGLSERLALSEADKSRALDTALSDLERSHQVVLKSEKLAAVGQLAASVGHELRNPLTAVRNAASFLTRRLKDPAGAADPKVPQFLGIIDRELNVSAKIISDLLDFAREREPSLQPCPLHPLVDEAIGLIHAGSVRILNEIPEDMPAPNLDRDQFRQVVLNLVQNAVEAMPAERTSGGVVTIRAEPGTPSGVKLAVVDNGAGIPHEAKARIFEPLFTTKTKGTGLGLAIVANMVRAHGGTIRVDSQPGHGSSFIIDLPMALARDVA
jgi:signal transduction histidine kinase